MRNFEKKGENKKGNPGVEKQRKLRSGFISFLPHIAPDPWRTGSIDGVGKRHKVRNGPGQRKQHSRANKHSKRETAVIERQKFELGSVHRREKQNCRTPLRSRKP